jgi:hypothetical protein
MANSPEILPEDDVLEGAEAVSAFLKSCGFKDMTAKKVYRLKDTRSWPIVGLPGMGIIARKSELIAYIKQATLKPEGNYGDGQKAPVADKERHVRSVGR